MNSARRLICYISAGWFGDAENQACNIVKNMFDGAPVLGIDIDGTIDEYPEFYSMISRIWPGDVFVITCRRDREKTVNDLRRFNIYYDDLILVGSLDGKAKVISELGVNVFVDDQDECTFNIPVNVLVLKARNGGNFEDGKWLYSEKTGKRV